MFLSKRWAKIMQILEKLFIPSPLLPNLP
jgi:hypothetical protein